jgi:ribosomal protein S18 acetylase RimI-like enzyme
MGDSLAEIVTGVQERAARALPAEVVEDAGGWWLRHAPGCAWWAGTVLPYRDARPGELLARVVGAEKFYAGHGAVARFQISPPASPEGLDSLLAQRGYRQESPMFLLTAPAATVLEAVAAGPLRVDIDDGPTPEWFSVWQFAHNPGSDPRCEWAALERVAQPCAYARAVIGDDTVAVGRAVADTGWAGIFAMATLPHTRGQGVGRSVLAALVRWAAGQQAASVYLQVERANLPAVRLYQRAGFTELCAYHYRAAA